MGNLRHFWIPVLVFTILVQWADISNAKPHKELKARGTFPLAKKRETYEVTLDGSDSKETTNDILARLKLLAYAEKLKTKQLKKAAKAEQEKQLAAAYMNALTSSLNSNASSTSPGGGLVGRSPGLPLSLYNPYLFPSAPSTGIAPPMSPMPMMPFGPAMGLWKKAYIMNQLYGPLMAANAAAAQQQQLAAAPPPTNVPANAPSAAALKSPSGVAPKPKFKPATPLTNPGDEAVKDIAKRFAPLIREYEAEQDIKKKDDKENKKERKHGKKDKKNYSDEDDDEDDDDDDDDEEDEFEEEVAGSSNRINDESGLLTDEGYAGRLSKLSSAVSGASNRFGTAPGKGSPVSQAGCSGSHIHVCSGTTVYLNSPENLKNNASPNEAAKTSNDDDDDDNDDDNELRNNYKQYRDWIKSWRHGQPYDFSAEDDEDDEDEDDYEQDEGSEEENGRSAEEPTKPSKNNTTESKKKSNKRNNHHGGNKKHNKKHNNDYEKRAVPAPPSIPAETDEEAKHTFALNNLITTMQNIQAKLAAAKAAAAAVSAADQTPKEARAASTSTKITKVNPYSGTTINKEFNFPAM